MEAAGVVMLLAVAILLIATGLPAFMILIGVATLTLALSWAWGLAAYSYLTALPLRVIGLLESDLLQALPLYVLMAVLLDRLPLAELLFRAGCRVFRRSAAAPLLSAIGLGALLGPMNGSVGAGVTAMARIVHPKLAQRGVPSARGLAVVCVASTLGVVVPPSLVLILLSDAMLRAHTEAINATGIVTRVVNTQDIFRGAIGPAALFLLLCFVVVWRMGRGMPRSPASAGAGAALSRREWLIASATVVFIVALLGTVALGFLYPVEAAAAGAVALALFGIASGTLTRSVLAGTLRTTMAITGALFALLVAATTFTFALRVVDGQRLFEALIAGAPGGAVGAAIAVMGVLFLCAFVLDAFEMIFVIVPVVMPPLLTRTPDAVWVAALALLALQASFLLPPFGYAVMLARGMVPTPVAAARLMRAVAPFLVAQLLVLGATIAFPALTHVATTAPARAPAPVRPSDDAVKRQLEKFRPGWGD